ncbi:hypothetical protein H1R20_g13020, partial [Candolleomyces eurysporus]
MPYYAAELDSDDEGSVEYNWENDDDDVLSSDMDRLRIRGSTFCVNFSPGMQIQASIQSQRSVCRDYVTCGLTCIEKLCKDGPSDTTLCTYCHRRPKVAGKDQCGQTCADKAKIACLLCKARPRNGRYHLCGRTCKRIATKSTPLILEIPKTHTTYDMVEDKFKSSWSAGATNPLPKISKIFKIIENNEFLMPYDQYKFVISVSSSVYLVLNTALKEAGGSNRKLSVPWNRSSVPTRDIDNEALHVVDLFGV